MAGIYIHIPFCKQACHYCDFHFSTSVKYKDEMIFAIIKELDMQKTNPFVKASLCLYNIMNKCRHGINCRYAHHTSELKSCPDGKKCNFPKCIFTKH